MSANVMAILIQYGQLGVEALKADVQKVSATGETADSLRFEVTGKDTVISLKIIARAFFEALETGRGPRKSGQYGEFDIKMYEYMQARGIGSDLPEKKRRQLAKFLTYKINKEGDSVYKAGGRIVYSPTLQRIIEELTNAIKKDVVGFYVQDILKPFKAA